jgi:hypothetical protein
MYNNYQGQVVDASTGAPLQGVTISIDGTGVGVTDSDGRFSISTTTGGQSMSFSYVGYTPESYPVGIINDLNQIQLTLSVAASTLPAVTVTPTPAQIQAGQSPAQAATAVMPPKRNYTPYILAGGAGLLLLASRKRGQVGKMETGTVIALVGAAGLLVYFLTRPRTTAPVYSPSTVYNPAYLQSVAQAQNPVAGDIAAGGQAASSILQAISNF